MGVGLKWRVIMRWVVVVDVLLVSELAHSHIFPTFSHPTQIPYHYHPHSNPLPLSPPLKFPTTVTPHLQIGTSTTTATGGNVALSTGYSTLSSSGAMSFTTASAGLAGVSGMSALLPAVKLLFSGVCWCCLGCFLVGCCCHILLFSSTSFYVFFLFLFSSFFFPHAFHSSHPTPPHPQAPSPPPRATPLSATQAALPYRPVPPPRAPPARSPSSSVKRPSVGGGTWCSSPAVRLIPN